MYVLRPNCWSVFWRSLQPGRNVELRTWDKRERFNPMLTVYYHRNNRLVANEKLIFLLFFLIEAFAFDTIIRMHWVLAREFSILTWDDWRNKRFFVYFHSIEWSFWLFNTFFIWQTKSEWFALNWQTIELISTKSERMERGLSMILSLNTVSWIFNWLRDTASRSKTLFSWC